MIGSNKFADLKKVRKVKKIMSSKKGHWIWKKFTRSENIRDLKKGHGLKKVHRIWKKFMNFKKSSRSWKKFMNSKNVCAFENFHIFEKYFMKQIKNIKQKKSILKTKNGRKHWAKDCVHFWMSKRLLSGSKKINGPGPRWRGRVRHFVEMLITGWCVW